MASPVAATSVDNLESVLVFLDFEPKYSESEKTCLAL